MFYGKKRKRRRRRKKKFRRASEGAKKLEEMVGIALNIKTGATITNTLTVLSGVSK